MLYGIQCWILNSKLRKRIDGSSTLLLRMVQNIYWKSKTRNEKLYNLSPKATDKMSERMFNIDGHCIRHTKRNGPQPHYMDTHTRIKQKRYTVYVYRGSNMSDRCWGYEVMSVLCRSCDDESL